MPTRPLSALTIRPATAADQATITAWVRGAGLNPMRLHWPNFLLAEQPGADGPTLVGMGQLRPHGDVLELASLVVAETARGQGVGGQLIAALIARAAPSVHAPLYLICEAELTTYYARFGFGEVQDRASMPPYFRRIHRFAHAVLRVVNWLTRQQLGLAVMAYPAPLASAMPSVYNRPQPP